MSPASRLVINAITLGRAPTTRSDSANNRASALFQLYGPAPRQALYKKNPAVPNPTLSIILHQPGRHPEHWQSALPLGNDQSRCAPPGLYPCRSINSIRDVANISSDPHSSFEALPPRNDSSLPRPNPASNYARACRLRFYYSEQVWTVKQNGKKPCLQDMVPWVANDASLYDWCLAIHGDIL